MYYTFECHFQPNQKRLRQLGDPVYECQMQLGFLQIMWCPQLKNIFFKIISNNHKKFTSKFSLLHKKKIFRNPP